MEYDRDERRARRRGEVGLPNEDAMVNEALVGQFDQPMAAAAPPGAGGIPDMTGAARVSAQPGAVSRGTAQPVNHTQPVGAPSGIPEAPSGGPGAPPAGAPAAATASTRSYDYIPGAEDLTYGDTSRMSGFNTNEWGPGQDTEGYDEFSYKNSFGKIASRMPPEPDSVRALFAGATRESQDFLRNFPNAVLLDHPTDPKIQFEPGDPPVDVLIKSGQGGWGWQPEGEGGGPAGGGPVDHTTGAPGELAMPGVDALGNSDTLAQIQAALAAMGRGEQPFLDDSLEALV